MLFHIQIQQFINPKVKYHTNVAKEGRSVQILQSGIAIVLPEVCEMMDENGIEHDPPNTIRKYLRESTSPIETVLPQGGFNTEQN